MKRCKGFFGIMALGALAFSVSVYGAPRADGARGPAKVKSQASRLVTGASTHLNTALTEGGVAAAPGSMTITPASVSPATLPTRLEFEVIITG